MAKKISSLEFIFILLFLIALIIIGIVFYYNLRLVINYTTLFIIVVPSSTAAYYCKRFLENFEKREQYVATLIFIHPKVKEWFKRIFIATFIFGISWCFSIWREFEEHPIIKIIESFGVPFSTYIVLIFLTYFFKNLYEITKSD